MSILSYNGASIIGALEEKMQYSFLKKDARACFEASLSFFAAMTGADCVAIACDTRFGIQNQTNATDMPKVFKIHDRLFVGLAGLATDMMTLNARFQFRHNLYRLREDRDMKPSTFAHFCSGLLYEKRFGPYYCEPIVAGLEPDGTPFVTGMDLLGAMAPAEDFVVAGNSVESLLGVCESMYTPGLAPEALFEVISQCLLAGVNRDCLSGWGAQVTVVTKERVTTTTIKGRMD